MTGSVGLKGMIAMGFLWLPLAVGAESRLAAPGERASAQLMFKIVVPEVLSLEIGQMLTIGGNGHRQLLRAETAESERHQVILRGAAHRSLAQFADCSRAGTGESARVNCTVSMP